MAYRAAADARNPTDRPVITAASGWGGGSEANPGISIGQGTLQVLACAGGRARVAVPGLRGNRSLAGLLEGKLPLVRGVSRVKAAPLTGNVTVFFGPAGATPALLEHIAQIVSDGSEAEERPDRPVWHTLDAEMAARKLGSDPQTGLSAAAAMRQLDRRGPNALRVQQGRSPSGILVCQLTTAPVLLLGGVAVLSLLSGALFDAVAVAAVVCLNTVIGFATEAGTETAIRSLSRSGPRRARVVRQGTTTEIGAEEIVPGDLVALERGDIVPADCRLIASSGLTISEAALTGESQPIRKNPQPLAERDAPLARRTNMAYRGTIVTGGSGTAIVVATGLDTEVGRIKRLVDENRAPETPSQRQLAYLGRKLLWLSLGTSVVLLGIGFLRGFAVLRMMRSALSLAVAAIPEGLPMVATTTLALGVKRMAREKVLIRRLDAVETLGSVSVVCFDKTGTLTFNRMSVACIACGDDRYDTGRGERLNASGASSNAALARLLEIGCLCSEVELENGHLPPDAAGSGTEIALLRAAAESGVSIAELRQRYPLRSVQERTETKPLMATKHRSSGGSLVAVKGAPREVLAGSTHELDPAGTAHRLTEERRAVILRENDEMGRRGLRVLGFAFGENSGNGGDGDPKDLTWVGLAGFADPIRPGLPELMRKLHGAGVQTVVLTGDQPATARAVAEQIGLDDGIELKVWDCADRPDLTNVVDGGRTAHVFARITPADKLKIVRSLQRAGAVVAMVGDGINDSPALRAAEVGLAMGRVGDSAAQEVADALVSDDDVTQLATAIEHGRTTVANVRGALRFLLGTNTSEIVLMLVLTALSDRPPLSPVQLLWINLISDVLPCLGLALEPPAPDVMARPPSRNGSLLAGEDMPRLILDGARLALSGFLAGAYGGVRYGGSGPQTGTMTFTSLIAAQLLHALGCRTGAPTLRPFGNPALYGIVTGSMVLQALCLEMPLLRQWLGLARLSLLDRIVVGLAGSAPFAIDRIGRALISRSPRSAS